MKFNHLDIVVWNGMITQYGIVKHLISDSCKIRLADEDEKERYNKRP